MPLVGGSLLALGYLETALYTNGHEPFQPFGPLHQTALGRLCLSGLVLLNGWLLDQYLASRTREDRNMPIWLRSLRWAVACVPVLGIAAIPLWRWILANPPWAVHASPLPTLSLTSSDRLPVRERLESWRRHASSSLLGMGVWVIACQTTPFLTCISWLGAAKAFSPSRRTAVLTACMLFHCIAWAVAAQYSRTRRQQLGAGRSSWIGLALRWGPPMLLLPLPLPILGMLVLLPQTEDSMEETTLVHTVLLSRARALLLALHGASHRSSPLRLLSFVRRAPEASMPYRLRAPGELERRRLVYYRLKSFLLLLDGAAMSLLAVHSAGRGPGFTEVAPFLALATLGLVAEVTALGKQLATAFGYLRPATYRPWGRSLMNAQLALAGGLLMGTLVAQRSAQGLATLLLLGLPCSVTVLVFFSPLDFVPGESSRSLPVRLVWSALFIELSCVGAYIRRAGPEAAEPVFRLITTAAVLTPLWNLGLGILFGAALLHPLTWRDPIDHRRPVRARIAPMLMVLSALLPLGGLANPFWIYLRHRLLPATDRVR